MAGGLLGKLFGGGGNKLDVDERMAKDLVRLNKTKTGLGDQAIRYVLTGEGGEVLSTLATVNPQQVYGRVWSSHDPIRHGRATWLVSGAPDVGSALRYADVIASFERKTAELPGFSDTPMALRAFIEAAADGFYLLDSHPRQRFTGQIVATPEFLVELTRQSGARLVDLWGALFASNTRWHYGERSGRVFRQVLDLAPLARTNPETLEAAAKRMSAAGRTDLMEQLGKWNVLDVPALRQIVLGGIGDTAKSVREAARATLKREPDAALFADLEPLLQSGQSQLRQSAAEILAGLKLPAVREIFTAHMAKEKVSAVRTVMEAALRVHDVMSVATESVTDCAEGPGYIALDGSFVAIPPMKPRETPATGRVAGAEELAAMMKLVEAENNRRREVGKKHGYNIHLLPTDVPGQIVDFLNGGPFPRRDGFTGQVMHLVFYQHDGWLKPFLARLTPEQALKVAIGAGGTTSSAFHSYSYGVAHEISAYVEKPGADFRLIEQLAVEAGIILRYGTWSSRGERAFQPGDVLRDQLDDPGYGSFEIGPIPPDALWPYLAENLDIFREAFGLRAPGTPRPDKFRAVVFLKFLPKMPREFLGPLLDMATANTKAGREEARALLKGAPGLTGIVAGLLADGRQDSRAGAARWLGDIGDTAAIQPLKDAVAREKSELARAAMLSALRRLGEPIDHYVGPKALISDAEQVLKKTKDDKLAWLLKDRLPSLQFADGSTVPEGVPKAWALLAVKLKQPGGNALFDIYLDQLTPASAQALSTHLLDAWINYDTETTSHEDANAYAEANAKSRFSQFMKWYKDYTVEKAFRDLYNEKRGLYFNSGAETKGLLGLTKRTAPAHAAAQVRAYLKNHGARTAQSSALLEMLAAMADPVALQVLIAAATRLKQKTVQTHAGALVQAVAEQRNWTMDELADRTVPTAGLNDEGVVDLPIGEGKVYTARLDGDLKFQIFNPDGKPVSALPAADDEQGKASKAQLSASKKELSQAISMQSARLYEALCGARTWASADWQRDFREHPLMARLTERLVWQGLDGAGQPIATFRPMPEGDLSDAADDPVDPAGFVQVRLAHAALLSEAERQAWITHLKDYEVKTLFAQLTRPVLTLTEGLKTAAAISDRKGWITDTFTFRGNASKLGYQRGDAMDGGYFSNYFKTFRSAGILANIEFTGNSLPEENITAIMYDLTFHRLTAKGTAGAQIDLKDVPPVLLSECWQDYHDIVAKAAFDPDWEKKKPW